MMMMMMMMMMMINVKKVKAKISSPCTLHKDMQREQR